MLWTTPESCQETLPLIHRRGDLALTAAARLDNRDELLAVLGMSGGRSNAVTDSALILAAYEAWGERCPEKLVGDFAFALWDGRRQVLFCARDHFGVKPFYYYYRAGQCCAFATEIKALLCLPEVPRRLNEVRIVDYLDAALLMIDTASTFYQDIWRLPAGHSLTVDSATMVKHPYWSLDPRRELRYGSDAEYAEAFRELFIRVVHGRLRSAFPVGSMLSGSRALSTLHTSCQPRHDLSFAATPLFADASCPGTVSGGRS